MDDDRRGESTRLAKCLEWTLLSCVALPLLVSFACQVVRGGEIISRGIEIDTVSKKFALGLAVDSAQFVLLSVILNAPLILLALYGPVLLGRWWPDISWRMRAITSIIAWQLPVVAVVTTVLDGPGIAPLIVGGVLSLMAPPLFLTSLRLRQSNSPRINGRKCDSSDRNRV